MISLQQYHTFALPAKAHKLIEINDAPTLKELDWTQPYYLLGEGSNTVFLDDFSGQIIHIANTGIEVLESEEEFVLTVAAGENWHKLPEECANVLQG